MQKDALTLSAAHFRLLSEAIDELCSAGSSQAVAQIGARLARHVSDADALAIFAVAGEHIDFVTDDGRDCLSDTIRSGPIARLCTRALESGQTVVIPDTATDEKISSPTHHYPGYRGARSLVVVPVGRTPPYAAVVLAWVQEHWPAAAELLVIEALSRSIGLALRERQAARQANSLESRATVSRWLSEAAADEGVQGSERQQWLAMAELQHRVRNVLGVVRSLVRKSAQTSLSTQEYSTDLESRIAALARTQALVMRQQDDGVDLEELVNAELAMHAGPRTSIQCAGPPVRLRPRAAETMSLALHELAINAAKHGALAAPQGRVTVAWSRQCLDEMPCVRVEWLERHANASGEQPRRRGFGHDLIEQTVPYELHGAAQISFEPQGFRCTIDFPATADNIVAGGPLSVE